MLHAALCVMLDYAVARATFKSPLNLPQAALIFPGSYYAGCGMFLEKPGLMNAPRQVLVARR